MGYYLGIMDQILLANLVMSGATITVVLGLIVLYWYRIFSFWVSFFTLNMYLAGAIPVSTIVNYY